MIRTKQEMYALLASGALGNTIPQYLSLDEWRQSECIKRYNMWGVRSGIHPSHPACRLYCPTDEVGEHVNRYFPDGPNISMMIDKICNITAWLEVCALQSGLHVQGIEYPDITNGWTWRNSMKSDRLQSWKGIAAYNTLKRHMNANSLEDLFILLDKYPQHVVEFSATDSCFGSHPHRNCIIWEVRAY